MRQIHKTQKGYICPSETPEGKQVGLIKNLASTCVISPGIEDIYEDIIRLISQNTSRPWVVYNGMVIGTTRDDTYV
ncbi:hypothetical protein BU17DRAFT_47920 [Hysterangium stoloniferum]|nr:hypothetical protein BU17DRAFT_47920 [Hysterangium stoloniferum]